MSMIGPVLSRCREGSSVGKRSLRWEGFVEKVGCSDVVLFIAVPQVYQALSQNIAMSDNN